MEIKVIYGDGSIGVVNVSRIDDLTEEGKIVAYEIHRRWVEVRRSQASDPHFQGPERRKSHFIIR